MADVHAGATIRHMNKSLALLLLLAAALSACAPGAQRPAATQPQGASAPAAAPALPVCEIPARIEGMAQIAPLEEQVAALWSLGDFPDAAFVEYWFEDERGDSVVGVSDGARRWRALLQSTGGAYVPAGRDWLQEQTCSR